MSGKQGGHVVLQLDAELTATLKTPVLINGKICEKIRISTTGKTNFVGELDDDILEAESEITHNITLCNEELTEPASLPV